MRKTSITFCLATVSLVLAASASAATPGSQRWKLHKVSVRGAVVIDSGTVRGGTYGPGTVRVKTTAHPDGTITLAFRERLTHGSLTGQGRLTYRFTPAHDKVVYHGTGRLTGGTGRYSHTHASIRLAGTGLPNGDTTISISGA